MPDLDEAHAFFVDVLGCEYMYTLGPFVHDDSWMSEHLNVADDTVMRQLHFFRLGGQAIFEVFEYEAADQRTTPPRNSDIGGHHVALYVDDLDAAVAHLRARGLTVLGEPTASSGPSEGSAGCTSSHRGACSSSWSPTPHGKAFDKRGQADQRGRDERHRWRDAACHGREPAHRRPRARRRSCPARSGPAPGSGRTTWPRS